MIDVLMLATNAGCKTFRVTETWSILSSLPSARSSQICSGLVEYPDGTTGILFTCGRSEPASDFLNLDTLLWESKAPLPHDIFLAESVPYKNSFLIAGGESVELITYGLDTIYYYSPEDDEWQLLGRMKYGRNRSPSFLIPDWYANCTSAGF